MNFPIKYAQRIAYSTEETLAFTYEMGLKYRDSQGVYVESGTAAGAQVIALAHAAPKKRIYAMDSFEGIPLASNRDDQAPGIKFFLDHERTMLPDPGKQVLESSGATAVCQAHFWEHIKNALGDNHNIITVPGWFENTAEDLASKIDSISILRCDGDLFNSTWVILQHLFPKCHKGSVIIIDDWELPGCQAACREYFELIGYEPDYKSVSNIKYFFK